METIQISRDLVYVVAPQTQTEAILACANEQGWNDARIVGKGGMIDRPIRSKNAIVMPLDQFPGIIPPEGQKRMEIMRSQFGITKFLVADDHQHSRYQKKRRDESRKKLVKMLKVIGLVGLGVIALPVVAMVIGAIAITALIAIASLVSMLATGVAMIGALVLAPWALATFDPLIIAVTEDDGSWVCFYEYWD